jgi:hypothetical protein
MRFNADRLAALAGVVGSGDSKMLTEGNRSLHDDPGMEGEAEHRFGKGQLAEDDSYMDEAEHEEAEDADEGRHLDEADEADEADEDDEVVEIDEAMLRREILRMKKQKAQAIAENKFRKAVRAEIREMFGRDVYNDSDWVYGNNKPSRSKRGQVAMGALGIGFKK